MNLYWLEQTEADVPAENDWLSAVETQRLEGLRFPKRRGDWRLGRWTAKRAVAAYLNLAADPTALAAIEIRPAPSGAPEVFLADGPAAIASSLSHSAGTAVCAVTPFPAAVGCDLEVIEPRSDGFFDDYFTAEEQAMVARMSAADRPWLFTLLWSAKESALKALRVGLRADTRSVRVNLVDTESPAGDSDGHLADPAFIGRAANFNSWFSLRVDSNDGKVFRGWWQRAGNLVRTVVADPPPASPIRLELTPGMIAR